MWRVVSTAIGLGAVACLASGCSKKTQDGMSPATDWSASPETAPSAAAGDEMPHFTPPPGMRMQSNNPHAGVDMGGDPSNPHAGVDMAGDPSDPHAGLDMSQNPHAGGGTDVTKLGLAAPDPDRPIDPTHRIAGTVTVDPKAKDRAKAGTPVFLIVKRAGPDGNPSGPPLAVDKLSWRDGGVPFELTDAQAMVAGTELTGEVIVMARYDQDADALSREPGDITGQVRVKIPAENVKLALDTVLP
ncbi:MAG TPA: hypothetical protein VFK02_33415 [Kofleriaceae bacterium]|nr:hypothetical protein [Kofleriaceae bacterium]